MDGNLKLSALWDSTNTFDGDVPTFPDRAVLENALRKRGGYLLRRFQNPITR